MMFIAVFSGRFFPIFSMRFIDYLSFKYCFLKMMRETIHTKNKQTNRQQPKHKITNVCSGNIVEVAHENREKTIIIHYYYCYCVRSHQGFARKNDGG